MDQHSFASLTQHINYHAENWCSVVNNQRTLAPQALKKWLTNTGSLTRKLIEISDGDFNVELVNQSWQTVFDEEARALGIRPRSRVLVREVRLRAGTQTLVYARTIIPHTTYQKRRIVFKQLGQRSIGEWLFTNADIQRGTIQINCFQNRPQNSLWARRSTFYISGSPIIVCEVFLPALLQQAALNNTNRI